MDFRPIVRDLDAFLLVARHTDEVAKLTVWDSQARKVPAVALRTCAFFRVWCKFARR